ncbi:MAG: alanine racemase C-terminal domain-containing protein, partial [Pseudomonadota bacterium]
DLTRPGISIYGGEATNDVPNPSKQVVKAEARILQIRDAKAGDTVGYGATHTLSRDSKIAVCGIGYADGYHRSASGSGVALRNARPTGAVCVIDGHKAPMLGRVSMDLTTFDVSDIPNSILENTDWVEVFGPELPIDEVAQACGTIGYELLTDLGNRYIREFVS